MYSFLDHVDVWFFGGNDTFLLFGVITLILSYFFCILHAFRGSELQLFASLEYLSSFILENNHFGCILLYTNDVFLQTIVMLISIKRNNVI